MWGKTPCSGCLKSSQTLGFRQKVSPGDGQRCPECPPGWPDPGHGGQCDLWARLGWAGLTRWQQLLSQGQLSDSSGREGDRPKAGLAFLWATVSWRESQDFIFFLMPLKVMLPSGTWRGCLMWWSCWQPPLHPGNCEQGIPVAFRPHHHLEMLSQHHVLHMNYPVHPYSIPCFS